MAFSAGSRSNSEKFAAFLEIFYARFVAPEPVALRILDDVRMPNGSMRFAMGGSTCISRLSGRSGTRSYFRHRWSYRQLRRQRRRVIRCVPARRCCSTPATAKTSSFPTGSPGSVFASGLNFPTGIAFRGNSQRFEVYVLESGVCTTSRCNDGVAWQSKGLPGNPFTADIRVFDQSAKVLRTLGKPADASTGTVNAFSTGGVVDIGFECGLAGGRLFATDNASDGGRIVTVDPTTGKVVPLITGLPAGPTGQLAFQDGWIYWGAGATTNSGVLSKSDGGPFGQPDIPCQDVTLSQNVFNSGEKSFPAVIPCSVIRTREGPYRPFSTPTPVRFDPECATARS